LVTFLLLYNKCHHHPPRPRAIISCGSVGQEPDSSLDGQLWLRVSHQCSNRLQAPFPRCSPCTQLECGCWLLTPVHVVLHMMLCALTVQRLISSSRDQGRNCNTSHDLAFQVYILLCSVGHTDLSCSLWEGTTQVHGC
jgi:hypothetical protein